jgi:hypothetical protein
MSIYSNYLEDKEIGSLNKKNENKMIGVEIWVYFLAIRV